MSDQPLVQFVDVEKGFPGRLPLYSNVNFAISRGEFLFLTGVSGAGKSTILRLILGLESPDRGRVLYNGYDVHRLSKKQYPKHLRSIGVVFQDYKLLGNKTAKENIGISLQIKGIDGIRMGKRVEKIAHQIGIENLLGQSISSLSGGEQQLVAIARAAVHRPLLILADEPTANLDRQAAAKIMGILRKLHRENIAVVISTHDFQVIKKHKIRTIVIKDSNLTTIQ